MVNSVPCEAVFSARAEVCSGNCHYDRYYVQSKVPISSCSMQRVDPRRPLRHLTDANCSSGNDGEKRRVPMLLPLRRACGVAEKGVSVDETRQLTVYESDSRKEHFEWEIPGVGHPVPRSGTKNLYTDQPPILPRAPSQKLPKWSRMGFLRATRC